MITINVEPNIAFHGLEGKSILDSALSAGLFFPYSCKTGRCNSCMCRIKAGKTQLLQDELGLTDAQRRDGWILACSRAALGHVELADIDVFPFELPASKTFPCRIDEIERFSVDLMRVVLRLPPSQELGYLAGQYIDVLKDGISRSYSIANAARSDRTLELHIKRFQGGAMSQYWFGQAQKNDLLRIRGPMGTFFLRNLVGRDLVFLSTGTGYAPVKAMLEQLRDAFDQYQPRSVTVYRGARTEGDLYACVPELDIPITYVPVLSRAAHGWTGAKGYVQDVCLGSGVDMGNATIYACGSSEMIADARTKLVASGLEPARFFSDAFVSSGSSY